MNLWQIRNRTDSDTGMKIFGFIAALRRSAVVAVFGHLAHDISVWNGCFCLANPSKIYLQKKEQSHSIRTPVH